MDVGNIDNLYSYFSIGLIVQSLVHPAVGSFSNVLKNGVFAQSVEAEVFIHAEKGLIVEFQTVVYDVSLH